MICMSVRRKWVPPKTTFVKAEKSVPLNQDLARVHKGGALRIHKNSERLDAMQVARKRVAQLHVMRAIKCVDSLPLNRKLTPEQKVRIDLLLSKVARMYSRVSKVEGVLIGMNDKAVSLRAARRLHKLNNKFTTLVGKVQLLEDNKILRKGTANKYFSGIELSGGNSKKPLTTSPPNSPASPQLHR